MHKFYVIVKPKISSDPEVLGTIYGGSNSFKAGETVCQKRYFRRHNTVAMPNMAVAVPSNLRLRSSDFGPKCSIFG